MSKQYDFPTVAVNKLVNSATDLILQGSINAIEMAHDIVAWYGEGLVTDIKEITGLVDRIESEVNAKTGFDRYMDKSDEAFNWLNDGIDKWQEEKNAKIFDGIRFDEIEDGADFMEFAGGAIFDFLPQMALLFNPAGLVFMGVSAGSQKYEQLEDATQLHEETLGLYGQKYTKGEMFLNAGVTGVTEYLSEKVTFGLVQKMRKTFKAYKGANLGFKNYIKTNALNYQNLKHQIVGFTKEGLQEGSVSYTHLTLPTKRIV